MADINYSQIKIVGVVEAQPNTKHGIINAVGYLDSSWNFVSLTPSDAKKFFPSRGKVFAPGFQDRYKNFIGKCIFAGMMHSNNDGADEYIWDRENGSPDEYGIVIANGIGEGIGDTPNEKYHYLKEAGYLDKTTTTYLRFGKKLYVIVPEDVKRLFITEIEFSSILKQYQEVLVTYDNIHYIFLGDNFSRSISKLVDIMPDSLLQEWLVKEFLSKEWSYLLSSDKPVKAISSLIRLVNSSVLHKPILTSRKERSASLVGLLEFSYQEMMDFIQLPELKETINKSIEANCETFIEKAKVSYAQELEIARQTLLKKINGEKEKADQEIAKIKKSIDDAKLYFNIANEELLKKKKLTEEIILEQLKKIDEHNHTIKEQEAKLQNIKDAKEHLLNDFDVIKEVIEPLLNKKYTDLKSSVEASSILDKYEFDNKLEYLDDESGEIKIQQTFQNRLEFYLSNNNRKPNIAKKIFGYMIHYKSILVPDNRIIQAIIRVNALKFQQFNEIVFIPSGS